MAGNITIPSGRQVEFLVDGEDVVNGIPLVLEEDVTFSASSSFGSLAGGGGKWSQLLSYIGSGVSALGGPGFGGQVKQMGLQVWQSTDPLSLKLDFTFYLGIADKWDGFEEVKKPIFELMKLTLPEEGIGGTLIAPGPSPLDIFKGYEEQGLETNLRSISLDIGGILFLPEVIIKQVQPTISSNVDDKGYPIWGQVSVDIQTLFTATADLIDEELENKNQSYSETFNDKREGTGAV